jgi:hypothetical protein
VRLLAGDFENWPLCNGRREAGVWAESVPVDEVRLLAPVMPVSRIFGLGRGYMERIRRLEHTAWSRALIIRRMSGHS